MSTTLFFFVYERHERHEHHDRSTSDISAIECCSKSNKKKKQSKALHWTRMLTLLYAAIDMPQKE